MKTRRENLQPRLQGFEKPSPRLRESAPHRAPNSDLVGRTFFDGTSHVFVKGLSSTNPSHVCVEREHDGHTWTIHAGVVRLIVGRAPRRRAA